MKLILAILAVLASFTGAFTVGTIAANASPLPAPGADLAACSAVAFFHHVDTTNLYLDEPLWQHAWHHAWHTARDGDPGLRRDIHSYLWTDRGWSRVADDCADVVPMAS